MDYVSTRIIASDVRRLAAFYEKVTGLAATWYVEDFAEIPTPSCTLAIGAKRTIDAFAVGAARPADNHTAIIEFRVADVDQDYARIAPLLAEDDVVQKPTTMPWGNRSLLFRDPDGNLINLFTPVSEPAKKRFGL